MQQDAVSLAREVIQRLERTDPTRRLLIGIAGIPASGKSTFALLLTEHINRELKPDADVEGALTCRTTPEAILVSLDGWHLTRSQLDGMPDPKLAHDRRGAHWTFAGEGYVAFLRSLREEVPSTTKQVIKAPSFDHALKDPIPDGVSIYPYHRIILIEGLYAFLAIDPWKEASLLLDERWLVQVDFDEARRRIVKRHVLTGVAKDMEGAIWRAEENDMPNGHFLLSNSLQPTRVIESKDDPLMNFSGRHSDTTNAN
ncbi:hypothetical protein APHAL10511_008222 [Amanita phalloides]|nr:hypothetical protein APHAL10511_008222 [Amanita phalloides]